MKPLLKESFSRPWELVHRSVAIVCDGFHLDEQSLISNIAIVHECFRQAEQSSQLCNRSRIMISYITYPRQNKPRIFFKNPLTYP